MKKERDFKGVWIPKEIYLDENLSANEKILFVEIHSLDRNGNGCFASNKYLADFLRVKERTINDYLVNLEKGNWIVRQTVDGKRKIYSAWMSDEQYAKYCVGVGGVPLGGTQKSAVGYAEIRYPKEENIPQDGVPKPQNEEEAPPNNTINNTINNNTISKDIVVGEQNNSLPPIFGKDRLKRIIAVYSLLWFSSYGTPYQANFGAIGKNFKPLLDSLSEWQIAALMIIHFNWHGADGTDEYAFKNLESAMHPILWIPSKVNEYGTYLTNVLKVDFFQNPDQIRSYVKTELKDIVKEGLQAGIIKNDHPNNSGKD